MCGVCLRVCVCADVCTINKAKNNEETKPRSKKGKKKVKVTTRNPATLTLSFFGVFSSFSSRPRGKAQATPASSSSYSSPYPF